MRKAGLGVSGAKTCQLIVPVASATGVGHLVGSDFGMPGRPGHRFRGQRQGVGLSLCLEGVEVLG